MSVIKRVLVTGASGFIGKRFVRYNHEKYHLETVSLQKTAPEDVDLKEIDVVVHFAGMAHQMQQVDSQLYFDVNHLLTERFATVAKQKGVKHFIYISTVKVYGDNSQKYLDLNSPTIPTDPYGASKLAAEQSLNGLASNNFLVAIIRPPLVYGPGVKGNLIKLLRLTQKNIPLPFKHISNERSIVFLDNLVELINRIIENRAEGIFIAGDLRPLSTSDLLKMIYRGMGKSPFWFKLPNFGLLILKVIKPGLNKRLFDNFVIDNIETNERLDFVPPYDSAEGIQQMVHWFIKHK